MAIDPKAVVQFLKESRVRLYEEEEPKGDDEDIKEGDKAKAKDADGNMIEGEVIEIHDEKARIKDADDKVHIVDRADLKKA